MKKWYWRMRDSMADNAGWRAYGKGGESVSWPDGPSDDWLRDFGFSTRAAAVRAAGGNYLIKKFDVLIDGREIQDSGLHFEIYRCYEIVIVDRDGNEVGNANYCYGTRADAEEMAKHELKIVRMEEE